jgi:hypothetical protein
VASLADLYNSFQAMVWMYINAAMQWNAVLKPGGNNSISPADVVHCGHEWAINSQGVSRCYPFEC